MVLTQRAAYRRIIGVRPKQLALCITGRKYLGGKEKATLDRKQ